MQVEGSAPCTSYEFSMSDDGTSSMERSQRREKVQALRDARDAAEARRQLSIQKAKATRTALAKTQKEARDAAARQRELVGELQHAAAQEEDAEAQAANAAVALAQAEAEEVQDPVEDEDEGKRQVAGGHAATRNRLEMERVVGQGGPATPERVAAVEAELALMKASLQDPQAVAAETVEDFLVRAGFAVAEPLAKAIAAMGMDGTSASWMRHLTAEDFGTLQMDDKPLAPFLTRALGNACATMAPGSGARVVAASARATAPVPKAQATPAKPSVSSSWQEPERKRSGGAGQKVGHRAASVLAPSSAFTYRTAVGSASLFNDPASVHGDVVEGYTLRAHTPANVHGGSAAVAGHYTLSGGTAAAAGGEVANTPSFVPRSQGGEIDVTAQDDPSAMVTNAVHRFKGVYPSFVLGGELTPLQRASLIAIVDGHASPTRVELDRAEDLRQAAAQLADYNPTLELVEVVAARGLSTNVTINMLAAQSEEAALVTSVQLESLKPSAGQKARKLDVEAAPIVSSDDLAKADTGFWLIASTLGHPFAAERYGRMAGSVSRTQYAGAAHGSNSWLFTQFELRARHLRAYQRNLRIILESATAALSQTFDATVGGFVSGVFDVQSAQHAVWVDELSRAQTPAHFGQPAKAARKPEISSSGVAYFYKNGKRNKTVLADAKKLLDADTRRVKSGAQLCTAYFVHASLCTSSKCDPTAHDRKAVAQSTITLINALAKNA